MLRAIFEGVRAALREKEEAKWSVPEGWSSSSFPSRHRQRVEVVKRGSVFDFSSQKFRDSSICGHAQIEGKHARLHRQGFIHVRKQLLGVVSENSLEEDCLLTDPSTAWKSRMRGPAGLLGRTGFYWTTIRTEAVRQPAMSALLVPGPP